MMPTITPILADAIDIPLVLGVGVAILVPLIAFEVFAEAFILRLSWRQPFSELCRFTFLANCWSLLAGIPAKILNAFIYGLLLPRDLPGFFSRYAFAVAVGSLVYFMVTILVEAACAFRWLRRNSISLTRQKIWTGILLANIATYAVLAPLHYLFTRPTHQMKEFADDARWTTRPNVKVVFVDSASGELKAVQVNGSAPTTLVPMPVKDYLVSENLNVCLFRSHDGSLYSYHRDLGRSNLVWQTKERFQMEQVAFSPSGRLIVFASNEGNSLGVFDLTSGKRAQHTLAPQFRRYDGPSLAWSTNESQFFIHGFESNGPLTVTIQADLSLSVEPLESTNSLPLLACYGRVGGGMWGGGGDWGHLFSADTCGDLKVWTVPGLGSGLRIYREGGKQNQLLLHLSVNPGLLHIAQFYFGDSAFLDDCNECLFEANGYVYLLDVQNRRVGTVARGERFILMIDRYRKQL